MQYLDLPEDVDRLAVAAAVRDIVIELNKTITFDQLSKMIEHISSIKNKKIEVSGNAIKQFASKEAVTRINKSNVVVPALFDFFLDDLVGHSEEMRNFITNRISIIRGINLSIDDIDQAETARFNSLGLALLDWLGISKTDIGNLSRRLSGKFYLFRKSTDYEDVVLKSTLSIEENYEKKFLIVTHRTIDVVGSERLARGILFPIKENLYIILESDNKRAMEFIVINNDYRLVTVALGLMTTTDLRGIPIAARAVMLKHSDASGRLGHRIRVEEIQNHENNSIREILPKLDRRTSRRIKS